MFRLIKSIMGHNSYVSNIKIPARPCKVVRLFRRIKSRMERKASNVKFEKQSRECGLCCNKSKLWAWRRNCHVCGLSACDDCLSIMVPVPLRGERRPKPCCGDCYNNVVVDHFKRCSNVAIIHQSSSQDICQTKTCEGKSIEHTRNEEQFSKQEEIVALATQISIHHNEMRMSCKGEPSENKRNDMLRFIRSEIATKSMTTPPSIHKIEIHRELTQGLQKNESQVDFLQNLLRHRYDVMHDDGDFDVDVDFDDDAG